MPLLGFSIVGSLLGTLIIVGSVAYVISAPPHPLMVAGGDRAIVKWAGPSDLKPAGEAAGRVTP